MKKAPAKRRRFIRRRNRRARRRAVPRPDGNYFFRFHVFLDVPPGVTFITDNAIFNDVGFKSVAAIFTYYRTCGIRLRYHPHFNVNQINDGNRIHPVGNSMYVWHDMERPAAPVTEAEALRRGVMTPLSSIRSWKRYYRMKRNLTSYQFVTGTNMDAQNWFATRDANGHASQQISIFTNPVGLSDSFPVGRLHATFYCAFRRRT